MAVSVNLSSVVHCCRSLSLSLSSLVVSLSSPITHTLQSLLCSPDPAITITAFPSLVLASRRSLDVALAAVLAVAQAPSPSPSPPAPARLPLPLLTDGLQPVSVSEVVPSAARNACRRYRSLLITLRPNLPNYSDCSPVSLLIPPFQTVSTGNAFLACDALFREQGGRVACPLPPRGGVLIIVV